MNTVFTAVNVTVLIFIITSGFIKGDLKNWHISKKTVLNATWEIMYVLFMLIVIFIHILIDFFFRVLQKSFLGFSLYLKIFTMLDTVL